MYEVESFGKLASDPVSLIVNNELAADRLNGNQKAEEFTPSDELTKAAIETIVARVEAVTGDAQRTDEVRRLLKRRVDVWHQQARRGSQGSRLGYEARRDGSTLGLLQPSEIGNWNTFTCLSSLRDVEPAVNLVLDDYGMDAGADAEGA